MKENKNTARGCARNKGGCIKGKRKLGFWADGGAPMGPQGRVQTGSRLNRLGLILYIGCDRFFLHFFISLLSLFFLSQNCSLLSLIFSDQQRKIRRGGRPLWTAAPPPETTKKRTPFFKKKFSPFLLVFFSSIPF